MASESPIEELGMHALALLQAGKSEEAQLVLLNGCKANQSNAALLLLLGVVSKIVGDNATALAAVTRSLRLEETPEALFELASLHLQSGDRALARSTADRLRTNYPEWRICSQRFFLAF